MKSSQQTIEHLNQLLSDIVVLGQMAHSAHWNIEGSSFYEFHLFFEMLYNELQSPIDDIAERVRALGGKPLSSLAQHVQTSILTEIDTESDSKKLLALLEAAYQLVSDELNKFILLDEEDAVTQDMYIGYKNTLDKRLWMIRAFHK